MNLDTFKMNPYHFFDSKLLELEADESVYYDWKILVDKRKKQFPDYQFIVTDNEELIYTDFTLAWAFNNDDLSINLDHNHPKVYWVNVHIGNRQTHLFSDTDVDIIHENLVPQNIKSIAYLDLKGKSTYTHIVTNKSTGVFHQYLFFTHCDSTTCYYLQDSNSSKNKINQKHYLSKANARANILVLNKLKEKQLRDDFIEFEHLEDQSYSRVDYFAMNSGKCVSQVNSFIPSHVKDCETHQLIKHVLTHEKAQSFSKPNLMIQNPNVVASHGNSIGSYNEEELFYIMQRGINLDCAKKIIQDGIINKALESHPQYEAIKEYLYA